MKILNRFTGAVIFECDAKTMKLTVKAALQSRADLSGADLSRANLSRADLSGADLSGADLSRANLSRADFSWADLSRATIYGEEITKTPIQIGCGFKWYICITEKHIQIGCQVHKAEDWFNFTDEQISEMHDEALPFWKKNKEIIKALWEHHTKDKQCSS